MAFDRNPRGNAADIFIAGKTTEQVIRAIAAAVGPQTVGTVGPDNLMANDILAALVARFDRKAASREARAA